MKTAVFFVVAFSAIAQQPDRAGAGSQNCSFTEGAEKGTVTFSCRVDREKGHQMFNLMNELLEKQLDIDALIPRLGELPSDISQRQDEQGWPELTSAQLNLVTNAVAPFAGQKMRIVVPNPDRDTSRLADQLKQALESGPASWIGSVQTIETSVPSTAPIPLGIELRIKESTPAALSLGNSLVALFGPFGVHQVIDPTAEDGQLEIRILMKPVFAGNPALLTLCRAKVIPQNSCPWTLEDSNLSSWTIGK